MAATTFDTLTYARKLQAAGFTPQQAEAQAEALRAVVEENLATKQDLKELEARLLHSIELVRHDVELVRHDVELVRRDVEITRRDIIIWLGGIVVVATTTLGVLMKLL
jgi:hypothetical protein